MMQRGGFRVRAAGRFAFLCLTLAASVSFLVAQDDKPEGPPPSDYVVPTLRVFANTVQIPVLILDSNEEHISRTIAPNRFEISFDSGPWFRVTHARPEGDDPISLAILLDISHGSTDWLPAVSEAVGKLSLSSLTARDHVSIYVMSCALIRFADDLPATPGSFKPAVAGTIDRWKQDRKSKASKACLKPINLLDSVGYMIKRLHGTPGRRVLLAVSDGSDSGSINPWDDVRGYAQDNGVAIFGMMFSVPPDSMFHSFPRRFTSPFTKLCELSGGTVLFPDEGRMEIQMRRFVSMLRERYIVEFPRPVNTTAGEHAMLIRVDKANYKVRPAGASVPLPDPAEAADPSIPGAHIAVPEIGTKPLTKPK